MGLDPTSYLYAINESRKYNTMSNFDPYPLELHIPKDWKPEPFIYSDCIPCAPNYWIRELRGRFERIYLDRETTKPQWE